MTLKLRTLSSFTTGALNVSPTSPRPWYRTGFSLHPRAWRGHCEGKSLARPPIEIALTRLTLHVQCMTLSRFEVHAEKFARKWSSTLAWRWDSHIHTLLYSSWSTVVLIGMPFGGVATVCVRLDNAFRCTLRETALSLNSTTVPPLRKLHPDA